MNLLLEKLAKGCANTSIISGRLVSWLTLFMVTGLAFNILSSWLFNFSSILVSEAITWMHSANFLLAAAYTLNREQQVRVDIFYSRMSTKSRAKVDLFGSLFFLIPVCSFILWSSWSFVWLSWRIGETSAEAGGMPAIYLLKSLLLLMPMLLLIEAINQIIKNALIISKPALRETN